MEFIKKHSKGIIASVCLLLVLAVFGMATFTFARYTSSNNTNQQATVAKWGYVVTLNADNLFGKEYGDPQENYVSVKSNGTAIKASGETNVIAPGSHGSMTITIAGQAEVMAQLSLKLENVQNVVLTKTADKTTYKPVKWSLTDGGETNISDKQIDELQTAIAGLGPKFQAGDTVSKTYTLSWEWALGNGTTDADDTRLGQIANGSTVDGYTATTTLAFDLTVEVKQIQA